MVVHEEIIKSSLFAETMKIVGLRQAQNAGIEYDYHEEDQPTQSSEPVQVLCIYHLLYEVKHLLKFRFWLWSKGSTLLNAKPKAWLTFACFHMETLVRQTFFCETDNLREILILQIENLVRQTVPSRIYSSSWSNNIPGFITLLDFLRNRSWLIVFALLCRF